MIIEGKRYVEGKVVLQRRWNDRLLSLRIDAGPINFSAGQYTRLALSVEGEMITRPYSFANGPDDPICEFYYTVVPGGRLTEHLARLEPGDSVWLLPNATGFMVPSETPEAQNLWQFATGTGVAPFLSMLRSEEAWARYQTIVLVEAVRHAKDLGYRDEVKALKQKHGDRFKSVSFVSRETASGTLSGRIPPAILDGSLEATAGVPLLANNSQIMICGNPDMVNDSIQVLAQRGMSRRRRRGTGQISVENFW